MMHKYNVGDHLLFTSQYQAWSQYNGVVTITEIILPITDAPHYMIAVYHPRFLIQITVSEIELTRL